METSEGLQLPQFELQNITEYICDVTYAGGMSSIDLLYTITEQLNGHLKDSFTCQYGTYIRPNTLNTCTRQVYHKCDNNRKTDGTFLDFQGKRFSELSCIFQFACVYEYFSDFQQLAGQIRYTLL